MTGLVRILRHLFFPPWWMRVRFPRRSLDAIERAVHEAEQGHRGQIRVAVEASLALPALLKGVGPRQRAEEVFALLRVWDTEDNCGVLIYLLLADRDVEIVADRGLARRVDPAVWQQLCARMEEAFRRGDFEGGMVAGVHAVGRLLRQFFPASGPATDELPDRPTLL